MTESAKIVPFGKYKGQPVEAMVQDKSYTEWLTAQPWFREQFQPIYNVVVNNFGEPSETPEHNALQALFLDDAYCLAFAIAAKSRLQWLTSRVKGYSNNLVEILRNEAQRDAGMAALTSSDSSHYRWENDEQRKARLERDELSRNTHAKRAEIRKAAIAAIEHWSQNATYLFDVAREFEVKGVDVVLTITAFADYPTELVNARLAPNEPVLRVPDEVTQYRIEVKPQIGDDYPAVLRQMKRQEAQYLFVDQADPRGVTVDQMCKIFDQSNMMVVFKRDVDDLLSSAMQLIEGA